METSNKLSLQVKPVGIKQLKVKAIDLNVSSSLTTADLHQEIVGQSGLQFGQFQLMYSGQTVAASAKNTVGQVFQEGAKIIMTLDKKFRPDAPPTIPTQLATPTPTPSPGPIVPATTAPATTGLNEIAVEKPQLENQEPKINVGDLPDAEQDILDEVKAIEEACQQQDMYEELQQNTWAIEESKMDHKMNSQLFEGLNRASIEALQQLGIDDEAISKALRYLKQQKNHSSLDEVNKALDLIERERAYREQQAQIEQQEALNQIMQESNNDDAEMQKTINLSKADQVTLVRQKSKKQESQAPPSQISLHQSYHYPVYTWGDNSFGQLGLNSTRSFFSQPQLLKFTQPIKMLSCGADHTLLLTNQGTVYQIGRSYQFSKKSQPVKTSTHRQPSLLQPENFNHQIITQVAAGSGHNLALTQSGQVYSWGNGLLGQCGQGAQHLECTATPHQIQLQSKIQHVSCGVSHSSMITKQGKLLVFGYNSLGQLGYDPKLKWVSRPILSGGIFDSETCLSNQQLNLNKKTVPEIVLGGTMKYLKVECSSSLTVAVSNVMPYLFIFGNGQHIAWSVPELFAHGEKPLTVKCVSGNVYLQLSSGFYKIDTSKKSYEKIQSKPAQMNDADEDSQMVGDSQTKQFQEDAFDTDIKKVVSGSDFFLILKNSGTLYAKGSNRYGQLAQVRSSQYQQETSAVLVDYLLNQKIKDVYAGGCSCFAQIDEPNGTEIFLQQLLKANKSSDKYEQLVGFDVIKTNDGHVYVHQAMVMALGLAKAYDFISSKTLMIGLRLLYGELQSGKDLSEWLPSNEVTQTTINDLEKVNVSNSNLNTAFKLQLEHISQWLLKLSYLSDDLDENTASQIVDELIKERIDLQRLMTELPQGDKMEYPQQIVHQPQQAQAFHGQQEDEEMDQDDDNEGDY